MGYAVSIIDIWYSILVQHTGTIIYPSNSLRVASYLQETGEQGVLVYGVKSREKGETYLFPRNAQMPQLPQLMS